MRLVRRSAEQIALVSKAAGTDAAEIAAEVADGLAEFFSLGSCHFVLRHEVTTRGKELVVVCAEGKQLRSPLRAIIAKARAMGFDCIRYHPKNQLAGLALARIAGVSVRLYQEAETHYYICFLRETVGHGQ